MGSDMEIITIIIATYGAILATMGFILSLILGINEIRKENPKVIVKINAGVFIDHDGASSEQLIIFEAYNKGVIPVIITGCGWWGKDGKKYQILKPLLLNLPQQLTSRRKIATYYPCRWFNEFKDNENVIGFYFINEEGNIWKTKISNKQKHSWHKSGNEGYLIDWNSIQQAYFRANRDKSQ
jgi:hypothetical protein